MPEPTPYARLARSPWAALALLWAFTALAYAPSFDVPFTFDDIPNIVGNPRVQADAVGDLPAALSARGGQDRPVAMLSFALNHLAGGLDAFGYHLVNLAIHLANAALLLAVIAVACAAMRRHGQPAPEARAALYLAFFAAAIWALHPVNTQAVTYIVQRMTALAATFYLAAMLAFLAWRAGRLRAVPAAVLVAACFALGMGTKPIAVTLPAALWLLDVVLLGRWSRRHAAALAAMVAGAAALTAVHVGTAPGDFRAPLPGRDYSAWERLLTEGRVLWHYLGLYAWPAPGRLQLDYAWAHSRGWLAPATTLLAWAALAAVSATAFVARRRWPWPAFAWLFFVAASAVEASLLNLELVFEHRLYLPGAFLAAGLLALLPTGLGGRRAAALRLALLLGLGLLGAATVERNRQWADVGGFWAGELERGASIGRAAVNAAGRYNRLGQPEPALAVLERARGHVRGRDRELLALHRAEALAALGAHARAERILRAELARRDPPAGRLRYNLGQVLLARGRLEEAGALVRAQAVPADAFDLALQASVAQARGRPEQAASILQAFLEEHPRLPPYEEALLRFHLANVYHALERPDAAYRQYRHIVARTPGHWAAWAKIHQMLEAGGDHERAARVRRFLDERGVDPGAWR